MRLILKQGGAILVYLLGLYIGLLGIVLALAQPSPQLRGLNTAAARDTIFMTEPKYIYLNRAALRNESRKVVVVGASNVIAGFVPSELVALIPAGATVHNLGLGGANLTEVRQVIDLVQQVQSSTGRRRETFVLGIWYGMFGEDRLRWYTPDRTPGDTDIDIERYRYGFERRAADGPVPMVPWRNLDAATTAIYPFLLLDKLSRDAAAWVIHQRSPGLDELNTTVVSSEERSRYLDYWAKVMGAGPPIPEEQFVVLEHACEAILTQGSRLVLADLPLPRWHKEHSPYHVYYEHRIAELVDQFASRPGFAFLDLGELDGDSDFYDEVHPKPRVTSAWAERLAAVLPPLLSSSTLAGSASPTATAEVHLR
jgi:hypothetical protein